LAKDIYENSFEKIVAPQLSNENLLKSKLLQQQAYTYDLLEKYDLAIKYLEQAESNISKYYGKNNIEYASELEKLASVLIKRGDYAKSEELLKQALAILQLIDNRSNAGEKSTIYLTVAKLYSTLGMYEEAESALIKASKYSKKTRKTEKMAEVKSADEIASLYIKEGRFNEADELLKSTYTIKLKKLGEGNRELIPTLNLMGNLNIIVGNYGAAEKNIRQSMALSAKIFTENSLKYTEALRILEKLYSELGDVDKAEQTDNQILTIQKALLGNKHIDVAATLTRLALIKTYSGGDKAEAEKMLTEALEIIKFNLGEQSPAYADQLKNNAYFYIEAKRYPEAETAIDAADKIYTAKLGQKNVFRAELSLLKGNVYVLQEKFVPAQQKYLESKNLFADIFSTKHPNYVKATSKLARTYYINKEYPKSLKLLDEATANYLDFTKKYFPSLSFSEKSKYWNQIKEDFEFYNSLAFKMMEKSPAVLGSVYNNMLSTKAILLSSSIKVKQRILASKDQTLINKYNDWVAKKQFLISVLSMSKDAQTQLGVTPEGLEKEIQLLEKDLSESSELFAGSFDKKNVSWIDVRKSLRENEYAVEIIRFRSYKNTFTDSIIYAALIINKNTDKAPQIAVLPNGKQLENRYLKYYKNAVITKSGEDDESYGAYWAPIKKVIPDNATIYLSSEGVYNELNVESLQASNGKYVIDENFVIPVSNTKDLLTRSKTTKNTKLDASKAVLIGNPVFYASAATSTKANNTGFDTERSIARPNLQSVGLIKQLPGTETEVNEITKLFNNKNWNVKLLTQQITDEDSLKNLKSPKILHIATHGYFNPNIEETKEGMSSTEMDFAQNPLLRSGILLKNAGDILKNNSSLKINSENGVLTAYEAMDLNLDHTDLVVLSACETGKGDVQIGEGVFGLQRSILIAGAQHLVMTLFKVDDEVTKELMINFYSRWLETGELRKSFTEAKKIVKDKYKYPVYWGSFVMLGVD
jgi:CHAT domain-containing protein